MRYEQARSMNNGMEILQSVESRMAELVKAMGLVGLSFGIAGSILGGIQEAKEFLRKVELSAEFDLEMDWLSAMAEDAAYDERRLEWEREAEAEWESDNMPCLNEDNTSDNS